MVFLVFGQISQHWDLSAAEPSHAAATPGRATTCLDVAGAEGALGLEVQAAQVRRPQHDQVVGRQQLRAGRPDGLPRQAHDAGGRVVRGADEMNGQVGSQAGRQAISATAALSILVGRQSGRAPTCTRLWALLAYLRGGPIGMLLRCLACPACPVPPRPAPSFLALPAPPSPLPLAPGSGGLRTLGPWHSLPAPQLPCALCGQRPGPCLTTVSGLGL